jgi:hypothetical protein
MSDDLDELLRLQGELGELEPGPWHGYDDNDGEYRAVIRIVDESVFRSTPEAADYEQAESTAEHVAHVAVLLLNALPGLIERVRKAEAERDALREVAREAQVRCGDADPRWAPELRAALAKVPR